MRLKAFVLAFGGLVVCSAIISSFGWMLVQSFLRGPRLAPEDLVGGGIFGGLSLVVLVIAVGASLREWTQPQAGGERGFLAKAAPVLMLVGLVLGVVFARKLDADRDGTRTWYAERTCQARVLWNLDEAACRARAEACIETLFHADPPEQATLRALQDSFGVELGKANQAERRGEAGASERVSALTRLMGDLNDSGWQARYRNGVTACVASGK